MVDDYLYYEEKINEMGNTILQSHKQLDVIEEILRDESITHETRVEIVLELLEKLK